MTRLSIAAAAISAGLVGGSLWLAGARDDAGGNFVRRTSEGTQPQGQAFIRRIGDEAGEARSRQNSIRISDRGGTARESQAVQEISGQVFNGDRQSEETAADRPEVAVSSLPEQLPHLPAGDRLHHERSFENEHAPLPLSEQQRVHELLLSAQAALPDGDVHSGRELRLTDGGDERTFGSSKVFGSKITALDRTAQTLNGNAAVGSCFGALVSPDVLAPISSMSPEQIEAYTYLAGLLLNPHLAGGAPSADADRPGTVSSLQASYPEPWSVQALGNAASAKSGHGGTEFEFSDGDDAIDLEVEDGTVAGPYGRVGAVLQGNGGFAAASRNGIRESGTMGFLRFRDPVSHEGSTLPLPLKASYQVSRQDDLR